MAGDKPWSERDERAERIAALKPPRMKAVQWDLWVSAAYLRLLGQTQAEAGQAVGRCVRTVRSWEGDHERWPFALMAARLRWLSGIEDVARVSLSKHVPKDGWLALKVLERLDSEIGPAPERVAHSGRVEGAVAPQVHIYIPDNGRRPSERSEEDFEVAARKSREAALYALEQRGNGGRREG